MRLGVIGVRSKHLRFFQRALDQEFPAGQHRITHICGYDAPQLLAGLSGFSRCASAAELIDSVDAVVVALREGTQHAALAALCMERQRPVFVDKPFACSPQDARDILRSAEQTGVPCTGGSTFCYLPQVRRLADALPPAGEYTLSYHADPYTPFGGWYFYGSHLTDLCTFLFGGNWRSVSAHINGGRVEALVSYPQFTVRLCSSIAPQPLLLRAGRDAYELDETGCYRAGMAHFVAVAQQKEPGQTSRLLDSVLLMDGIMNSLRQGAPQYPEAPGWAIDS